MSTRRRGKPGDDPSSKAAVVEGLALPRRPTWMPLIRRGVSPTKSTSTAFLFQARSAAPEMCPLRPVALWAHLRSSWGLARVWCIQLVVIAILLCPDLVLPESRHEGAAAAVLCSLGTRRFATNAPGVCGPVSLFDV